MFASATERVQRRRMLALSSATAFALLAAGCAETTGTASSRGSGAAPASAASTEQMRLVEDARATLASFKSDPQNRSIHDMLSRARAVVVFPRLIKGGFIVGAEGGRGVMFARNPSSRSWSEPVFMGMANASLGLQAGVQSAETVMVVYSDAALQKLLTDKVKLGADVSVAVIGAGGGAEAATGTGLTGDIAVISRTQGLYGGVSLEGGVLAPDEEAMRAYYGRALSPREAIALERPASPTIQTMHATLGR